MGSGKDRTKEHLKRTLVSAKIKKQVTGRVVKGTLRYIQIKRKDIAIQWSKGGKPEFIGTRAQSGFIPETDRNSTKRRNTTSRP